MRVNKLEFLKKKIIKTLDIEFDRKLAYWRFKEDKIVFTNGCFDILHKGHIEYLAKAANLGDVLIIGLNSDESVKRLKGENRPVLDEESRAMALAAIGFVDNVVIFDEDTPYELIKKIQPDVLVKGADYNENDIVGADIVKAKGGEIKTIEFVEGYSTSKIIDKIKSF